jgi:UDP-glucose:(heptosyl)LPS alpha-1,3-glucosyltransferase
VFANKWRQVSKNIVFHKIPIVTFPKWLTTLSFAYFANRKIKRMGFDLIHTHERIFEADLWTVHSIPHRLWVKDIRRKKRLSLFDLATVAVERRLINSTRCRMYMPVSQLTMDKMLAEYPLDTRQMRVIHPGVDFERFSAQNHQVRHDIRQQFGVRTEDLLILFVSMNFELKGLDELLAALALLRKTDHPSPVKVLVVGKGDENKYTALAKKLEITDQVVFAGVRADMESIYQAADIFVLLSKFDTFGMVVTEAMAASLPVIISETVGARDLVENGVNGFIVGRQDIRAIRERISALSSPLLRLEMGDNARSTASENSWEEVAGRIITNYDGFRYPYV